MGKSADILRWSASDLPNAFLYITRLKKNKKTNNTFFELNILPLSEIK